MGFMVVQRDLMGFYGINPLVTNIAMENGHRNSGIYPLKWWFSKAMLNYQRVVFVGLSGSGRYYQEKETPCFIIWISYLGFKCIKYGNIMYIIIYIYIFYLSSIVYTINGDFIKTRSLFGELAYWWIYLGILFQG